MVKDRSVARARLLRAGFVLVFAVLLSAAALLVACGGSSGNTSTPPQSGTPNQLGTANAVPATCPMSSVGVVGSACYAVTISCPSVQNYTADIKITNPSGASAGTVIYTTGGGGNQLYEDQFVYGNVAINTIVQAGFTAVQTDFADTSIGNTGWLDGPGGPLLLSCRWATLAKWVHDNATIHPANTAFCATGNSGGAGVIAYALARFGEDSIFNFVLPTSGPAIHQYRRRMPLQPANHANHQVRGSTGHLLWHRRQHVS